MKIVEVSHLGALQYALTHYGLRELTVNEQNPQAMGFYEHLGFATYKRTDYDEQSIPAFVYEVRKINLFLISLWTIKIFVQKL